jgi:nitronate monooxygenase
MANATGIDMAVAVAEAGALGSYPCAALTDEKITEGVATLRARTKKPINLNFFCHTMPKPDQAEEQRWRARLADYYRVMGLDPAMPALVVAMALNPIDASTAALPASHALGMMKPGALV